MARGRIVKDTPKRGKLTKSQAKRIVEKVMYVRKVVKKQHLQTSGSSKGLLLSPVRFICLGRDARTGRFISREEAERRKETAIVETITVPKKGK